MAPAIPVPRIAILVGSQEYSASGMVNQVGVSVVNEKCIDHHPPRFSISTTAHKCCGPKDDGVYFCAIGLDNKSEGLLPNVHR